MSRRYIACDLGAESLRISLGHFKNGKLEVSEISRFANTPIRDRNSLYWNIPALYQETLAGLKLIGQRGDPIASVSCDSWGVDYLIFDKNGGLLSPTHHYRDPRSAAAMRKFLKKVPWEKVYEQTGIQKIAINTLFQLAAEKSKRLKKDHLLFLIGDGFNYLLSGVAKSEISLASTSQLLNPITRSWSTDLLEHLDLPPSILPPLIPSGVVLGGLRPEIANQTGLERTRVIAGCSHDTAAAVAGIPAEGENWAYLSSGTWSLMGIEVREPIITEQSRELNFTNEVGYGGTIRFLKNLVGLWIVQECRRQWAETDQDYDYDMLSHFAASAPPYESLINPADPRFLEPGNMPNKVAAFCEETEQSVPKKPGPVIRCVLESMALLYRRTLKEIELVTGRKIQRLHLVGGGSQNTLLNHFTAHALQIPVIVGPTEATTAGNLMIQAMALGDVLSHEEARKIIRNSFPIETIEPQPVKEWETAAARFDKLFPMPKLPQPAK